MPDSDLQLCLAHYRIAFPDLASLGTAPAFSQWKTEYDSVSTRGLSQIVFTANSAEGASATAQMNFDQKILLRALLIRRVELDPDFDDTAFARPAIAIRKTAGFSIRLSP